MTLASKQEDTLYPPRDEDIQKLELLVSVFKAASPPQREAWLSYLGARYGIEIRRHQT